jgi:hypothetical protein
VKLKVERWKYFVVMSADAFAKNSATADPAQLLNGLETEMWSEHCQGYRAIGLVLDIIHRLVCGRSVSVLRWMGQDKPTQLGLLERASLN